jgi:hypothetical protein
MGAEDTASAPRGRLRIAYWPARGRASGRCGHAGVNRVRGSRTQPQSRCRRLHELEPRPRVAAQELAELGCPLERIRDQLVAGQRQGGRDSPVALGEEDGSSQGRTRVELREPVELYGVADVLGEG